MVGDINNSVRHIRHHADEYGVGPQRFGVSGGSSHGLLSLMPPTRGGPLLSDGLGFQCRKNDLGHSSLEELPAWRETGRDLSSINNLSDSLPLVLIHHGNADILMPGRVDK